MAAALHSMMLGLGLGLGLRVNPNPNPNPNLAQHDALLGKAQLHLG